MRLKSEYDPLRRKLLRGALAGGCALGMPILAGCEGDQTGESPRTAAESSDAPAASPEARGTGKLGQAEAQYQDSPKGEQQCSNCLHFIAESNTCAVVEGEVSPEGWCMLWAKAG
jgi:hypothetical protein